MKSQPRCLFSFAALILSTVAYAQPIITTLPPATANEGLPYSFEIGASDPYGKLVVIDTPAMKPLPLWLSFQDPSSVSKIHLVAGPTEFSSISAMAFDRNGNLYLADDIKNMVFKVDTATGAVIPIAGTGIPGNFGNGGLATDAKIRPTGIAVDSDGNIYLSSSSYHVIRRIDAVTGIITNYVGDSTSTGDGPDGPVAGALLNSPGALFMDAGDTLYLADNGNLKIKKIDPMGILTHIAGDGNPGITGDGGAALLAKLGEIGQLVVSPTGEIYLPDTANALVRVIDTVGDISTLAVGTPTPVLNQPNAVAVDWFGNIYLSDRSNHIIRKESAGSLENIAGSAGMAGNTGDEGLASLALLDLPGSMITGPDGNLYLVSDSNLIRRIDLNYALAGTVDNTVAPGPATISLIVDNGLASSQSDFPIHVNLAPQIQPDTFSIAENSPNGTMVGTVQSSDPNLDNLGLQFGAVTPEFSIDSSGIIRVDSMELLDFESGPFFNLGITATDSLGLKDIEFVRIDLTNIAEATMITSPDTVTALEDSPFSFQLTVQSESLDLELTPGKLPDWLAATPDFQRIEDGSLYTIPVGGAPGGPPTNTAENLIGDFAILAIFEDIQSVDVDSAGNTYIYNNDDHRLYRIDRATSRLQHHGGDGTAANSGDGGQAKAAGISGVEKLTVAPSGDVYLAISMPDHIIRKIDSNTGIITTIAGTGVSGFSGDGGPATSAKLNNPSAVAVDKTGNVFIADQNNYRIRKIDQGTGQISTIAGNGSQGLFGNGGPANLAQLALPTDLILDHDGELVVADFTQIRRIDLGGIIDSIYNSANELTALALDQLNNPVVSDGLDLKRVLDNSVELLVQAGFGASDVIQDVANDPFGNLTYSRFRTVYRSITALKFQGIPDQEDVGRDTLEIVVDDGTMQTSSQLFIDVKNVNDAPIGQDAVLSLPENTQPGTLVYVADAFDQDGDSLTYELSSINPGSNFEMDSVGNVTVKESGFDYETIQKYILTLSATDPYSATAKFTVTINITNINEAPQFSAEAVDGIELEENDPEGFSINVLAVDEDGDPLTYLIVTEDLDTVFRITQIDTLIRIIPIDTLGINFEDLSNENITLTLEARDPGGLADSLEVSFTVVDVNEAPIFLDTIPDQTTVVNSLYSLVIDRELFDDPDGRAFLSPKVSLVILDSSAAPGQEPVWLSFQPSTLTLFGTPEPADTGLINLEVRFTDEGGLFGADTFALRIVPDTVNSSDSIPVGIGEDLRMDIKIFPNPARERVQILYENPSSQDEKWVRLLDLQGRIVLSSRMYYNRDHFRSELELNSLLSGIYLVAIQQGTVYLHIEKLQKE